jgi:hypothetical protein
LPKCFIFLKIPYENLEDHTLEAKYQALSQFEKERILGNLLAPNAPLPTTPPPFKSSMFPEITRQDVAIIFQILGYEHDRVFDEAILGLFSLLCPCDTNSKGTWRRNGGLINPQERGGSRIMAKRGPKIGICI